MAGFLGEEKRESEMVIITYADDGYFSEIIAL
jgi:hypothetical protein